jgi:hypothetical protein
MIAVGDPQHMKSCLLSSVLPEANPGRTALSDMMAWIDWDYVEPALCHWVLHQQVECDVRVVHYLLKPPPLAESPVEIRSVPGCSPAR